MTIQEHAAAPDTAPQALHTVLEPDAGENVGAIGLGIYVKMTAEQTRGAYSLFEYVVPVSPLAIRFALPGVKPLVVLP